MSHPTDLDRLSQCRSPVLPGVEVHARIDSTNRRALELAEQGAPHGHMVVADVQSRGRGRRGRSWTSGRGDGLLVSFVIRPTREDVRWEWLPLVSAVAVARTLSGLSDVAVKWPNDVLVGGRKISGILVERRTSAEGSAVVGIGLNVNQERFPADIEHSATSVRLASGKPSDRVEVALRLAAELARAVGEWQEDAGAVERSYADLLAGVGRAVEVRRFAGDEAVHGIMEGVDDSGCLVLRTGDGLRTFAAGDVTLSSR